MAASSTSPPTRIAKAKQSPVHVLDILQRKKALARRRRQTRHLQTPSPRSQCSTRSPIPRDLDQPLIDAYLARRALDYLVGFTLSPVLWRKLPGSRSPAASSRWRCA